MRRARMLIGLLAVTLAVTLLDPLPAGGVPVGPPARPPAQPAAAPNTPKGDDSHRPDRVSALLVARQTGRPVQVTGESSPAALAEANPDGSRTLRLFDGPGLRRDHDSWVPVDATLHGTGGPNDPVTAPGLPRPLLLGQDAKQAVSLQLDRGPVVLSSPDLRFAGRPQVRGQTVTFPGVAPGTDLQLEVSAGGVKTNLVLQTPSAPTSFRFHLADPHRQLGSLAQQPDGWSVFSEPVADGELLAIPPASAYAPRLLPPGMEAGSTPGTAHQTITRAGDGWDITERVDPAWMADKPFPIVLDPTINWVVRSDGTTLSPDCHLVSGASANTTYCASTSREVGYYSGGGALVRRSIFKFDLTHIRSTAIVTSATLGLYQTLAQNYTTTVPVEVHRLTKGWTQSATWNSNGAVPWTGGSPDATVWATSSLGTTVNVTKTWNVTSLVQNWVNGTYGNPGMLLRAVNETVNGVPRFASGKATTQAQLPSLTVSYNTPPDALASPHVQPCASVCSAASTATSSATPQLQGSVTDADGDSVTVGFEVWDATHTTRLTTGQLTGVPSGQQASWPVPSGVLADGQTFTWRAQATDSAGAVGPWSAWQSVLVDTTPPATPGVSSTQYPSGAWSGSPTTAGTFNFTDAASDVGSYLYGVDTNPPGTSVTATSGSASATFTPTSGPHHLYVIAVDQAGNRSGVTDYVFNVKPGAVTSPKEGDSTSARVTLQATVEPAVTAAAFQYRKADTDTWTNIPTGDLTGLPVTITGGVTSPLTWDVGSTLGHVDGPVQVQALLTGGSSPTTSTRRFTLDQNGFGRHATAPAGPGSVDLLTGNYALNATDVSVDAWGSDLTVARSFNSRDPAASASGPFGPGWTTSWPVDAASSDWARLDSQDQGASVLAYDEDGAITVFARKAVSGSGTTYTPEVGAEDLTLTSNATSPTVDATQFTLADLDGNATVFAVQGGVWVPSQIRQPTGDTTSYTFDASGRVTQILAPKPGTVAGSCAPLAAGCRALTITYATTTTASGGTLGDYAGRVQKVQFTGYDPATSAMATVEAAHYSYDATGRLREAWDPRVSPSLKTAYTYDAAGHVVTVTPPGEPGWTINYAAVSPTPTPAGSPRSPALPCRRGPRRPPSSTTSPCRARARRTR